MNLPVVRQLILKDLVIHRWSLIGLAVAVPAVALLLALAGGDDWEFVGVIVMTNALMYVGFFVPIGMVLGEKKPFIFSLPISPLEYTASKIVGGLLVFMVPWLAFLIAMPSVVEEHNQLPTGALVPAVLMLAIFLLSYLLTAGVALVLESKGWTLFVGMLIVPVVFGAMPMLRYVPVRLLENWASDRVVWDPEAIAALVLLGVLGLLVTAATFALQSRKRSFV